MSTCPTCGSDDNWCERCGYCTACCLCEESLFDADELGLDPEDDDLRRYPHA